MKSSEGSKMASLIRQMNNLKLQQFSKLTTAVTPSKACLQKIQKPTLQQTSLHHTIRNFSVFNVTKTSSNLFNTDNKTETNQIRNYKAKDVLRLRCKGCYFVRRHERLFVECKLKGRHKQMQKMPSWKLYKEDYSTGNVVKAAFWNYHRDRYYKVGDTQVEKFDWLAGRLGKTV